MRPIYHWTEDRIKAHIAICFIAFALVKQAIHRIKIQSEPMSFEMVRNHLLHAQVQNFHERSRAISINGATLRSISDDVYFVVPPSSSFLALTAL